MIEFLLLLIFIISIILWINIHFVKKNQKKDIEKLKYLEDSLFALHRKINRLMADGKIEMEEIEAPKPSEEMSEETKTGSIIGYVRDADGKAIYNAQIRVLGLETPHVTTSKRNGFYRLDVPAGKTYEIWGQHPEYNAIRKTIDVLADKEVRLNFSLKEDVSISSERQRIREPETGKEREIVEKETVTAEQPPPTAEPKPSAMEPIRDVLAKIWNWIVVGEEYRSQGVSMEFAIATTWLTRIGVIFLILTIGYFLKLSFERQLLGAWGPIALTIIVGFAMIFGGMKLLRGRYQLLGQGFMGGGLAALYFSMYAAGVMYSLITVTPAFLLVLLISVFAGYLAIRNDSLLLAVLGTFGGYLTPLTLTTSQAPSLPTLYTYMLLLGIGILQIAYHKQWRLLNYLSFVFTYFLFFTSLTDYQTSDFPVVITFLSLFFVLHSVLVYIYNISKGKKSSGLEIAQLVFNSAIYGISAYFLIENAYGGKYPAIMTISLAAFYGLHALLFLQRNLIDRRLIISLIALAGFYTTITMPILAEKENLTILWSLQALLFIFLGTKVRSNFLKDFGYLIYMIVFVRLLFLDVPRNFNVMPATSMAFGGYLKQMAGRLWTFGIAIASVFASFVVEKREISPIKAFAIQDANDTKQMVKRGFGQQIFFWFGILFMFMFFHLEFNLMFGYFQPLRLPVLTVLWCLMATYFIVHYLFTGRKVMFVFFNIFLLIAIFKIFVVDLASWNLTEQFFYPYRYQFDYFPMRFIDFGIVLALLYTAWRLLRYRDEKSVSSKIFGYTGVWMLFVYLTLELNSLLHWKLPNFVAGGITVLWSLFAISFIIIGIWKDVKLLRIKGLTLFSIVVIKILFFDLANMDTIYRVIAFLLVGIVFIGGSALYIRSKQQFENREE